MNGSLPFIHTLGLHLGDGWDLDDRNPVNRPGKEFWLQIKDKCPRLKALILDGFRDNPDEPWIEDSGLFNVLVCITLLNATKLLTYAAGYHQSLDPYRWIYTSAFG